MIILYIQIVAILIALILLALKRLEPKYFGIAIIIIALSIFLNISSRTHINFFQEYLPERKSNLDYLIEGKISLRNEKNNNFYIEVRNVSSKEIKNIVIYLLAKFKGEEEYKKLGEFNFGNLKANAASKLDIKFLTTLMTEKIRGIRPEALNKEVLNTIVLSAKYQDAQGNIYDDWIKKKPIYTEAKVAYTKD